MLKPRVIPCLLLRGSGLVKTVQFKDGKYIGDPLNAVRIFNEKEVDELILLDIDATCESREPDYDLLCKTAAECRMPFCYGGGVRKLTQFERLVQLGIEKVAVGDAAILTPELISQAAARVGSQSVVAILNIAKRGNCYELMLERGQKPTGLNPVDAAIKLQELGVGEIVLNNIDRDGMMNGYDLELIRSVKENVKIPITALGGAGKTEDLQILFSQFGVMGGAAGSLFVFKGRFRAVLINYPKPFEKTQLFAGITG